MLLFFFSLFKSITSIFKYFKWKKKEEIEGTIGSLLRIDEDKKNTTYVYSFTFPSSEGVVDVEYKDICKLYGASTIKEGDKIEIFYDTNTKQYEIKKRLKNNLWQYPVGCVICLAAIVISFVIVGLLSPSSR